MNKHDLIGCFDRVAPEHKQKQKMLHTILDSRKEKMLPVKRAAGRLSLAAAVIIICAFTATTAFAINLGWHEKLIEYLNPSAEQMEMLSNAVSTPNASLTKNNITITVKQTLADSFGIYVLYEMTVPEEIALNDDITWDIYYLKLTTVQTDTVISHSSGSSEILEQTGNKRTVLLHFSQTAPIENGFAKLTLKDLGYVANARTKTAEFVTLVAGEWELKWAFSYVDASKTIEVNKPVSINGGEYTITKIVISPMSVCVFAKWGMDYLGDDDYSDAILLCTRPIVNFKDGSQLAYDHSSKNASFGFHLVDQSDESEGIYESQLYYRFEHIINLDDVESITIGDLTIPVR